MKLKSTDVILFSGDSITDGNRGRSMDCNHIMGHGYQFTVASKLALENADTMPKFANKGYSGASMQFLLDKWQEDVLNNKPTVLNILAGINDCLYGFDNDLTPEEVGEKYKKALEKAVVLTKENLPETKIIICEPFYFPIKDKSTSFDFVPHIYSEENRGRPDRDETDEIMEYRKTAIQFVRKAAKEVADKYADFFVPLYDKFEEAISKSRTEYFTWDGTHPTIAGHALIAEQWLSTVKF